ncbi:MAG: hypothetical protein ACYCZF_10395 [Anaerolineae bacterium]
MQKRACSIGIELPSQLPVSYAVESAIEHLGVDYVNYYVSTTPQNASLEDSLAINREMLRYVQRAGLDFSLACYVLNPPDQAVCDAVAASSASSRFEGLLFDELEHCRLLYPHTPVPLADNASFTTLKGAYEGALAGYGALCQHFISLGAPSCVSTHIWPVLNHLAARAGFTVCPKICKELYSPVSLAIGMGAALQYDRPLWADVDMWYWGVVPGHPPEEIRSNLLLAYWAGVDRIYLEGAGYNLHQAGAAGIPFSLVSEVNPKRFQLTPIGEVLRWFCTEYVPAHPRPYTFRDLEPDIAIIHFPDSDHGQRYCAAWDERLYGSPHLRSSPDTSAWFSIWNLLTCGATGQDGLTHFKSAVLMAQPNNHKERYQVSYTDPRSGAFRHTFFAALNNVVVFDHLVRYERIKGIPLLYLSGVDVSQDTLTAILRCVDEGAILVAWGPLAHRCNLVPWYSGTLQISRGAGQIVATDDFSSIAAARITLPYLGQGNEIRYRFRGNPGTEVVLERVNQNEVTVRLNPTTAATHCESL